MKKILHIDTFTLACDAKGCGYEIRNAGLHSHWLNFPCPKCGANMLTERDHKAALKLVRFADWLNKWFGWMGREDALDGGKRVGVQPHNGRLIITERDKP